MGTSDFETDETLLRENGFTVTPAPLPDSFVLGRFVPVSWGKPHPMQTEFLEDDNVAAALDGRADECERVFDPEALNEPGRSRSFARKSSTTRTGRSPNGNSAERQPPTTKEHDMPGRLSDEDREALESDARKEQGAQEEVRRKAEREANERNQERERSR